MRPTKGEINCTCAWPQATAWANENSNVRLVWMPLLSSLRAASMPSQVAATLMSTRSMWMPSAWYSSMMRSARVIVALVSKLRRASTSVDTRPGMVARISQPKRTSRRSMISSMARPFHRATVDCSTGHIPALHRLEDQGGLVVASRAGTGPAALKSPVSATTVVNCLSASSWFMQILVGQSGRPTGGAPPPSVCVRPALKLRYILAHRPQPRPTHHARSHHGLLALPRPGRAARGRLVLQDARAFARLPVRELAERAHVSKPTVVRFAAAWATTGWRLQAPKLAGSVSEGVPFIHRSVDADDKTGDVLVKVVDNAVAAFLQYRNAASTGAIERAAEAIAATWKTGRRIEFYGAGNSGIVAQDAQHKFFRLGSRRLPPATATCR